jgi:hypothetical protein
VGGGRGQSKGLQGFELAMGSICSSLASRHPVGCRAGEWQGRGCVESAHAASFIIGSGRCHLRQAGRMWHASKMRERDTVMGNFPAVHGPLLS